MGAVGITRRLNSKIIWLIAVALSVVLAEGIVVPVSLYLKNAVDGDSLVATLVISLAVASLVAAVTIYALNKHRDDELHLKNVEAENLAEKKLLKETLWRQANYDSLTELPNRRLFYEVLKWEIEKSRASGTMLAVLYIDLGHLKEVNNILGYQSGDQLLAEAAYRLTGGIRESDAVARLSGDEFSLILPGLASNHIERVANDLLEALRKPYSLGNETVYLSASIGISICPVDGDDAENLLSFAGHAANLSKEEGGNVYNFYSRTNQEAGRNRLRMTRELYGAWSGKQFRIYFQPVADLETGEVLKAEALLRWHHPERGVIYPSDFIPLAEETGLIHDIGDWVFEESLKFGQRWSELAGRVFKVSVNVSPVQLRKKERIEQWIRHFRADGASGQNIIVEITEGGLIDDNPNVDKLLIGFRDAGIEVALDDFGTGYASLSYLKKFHVDYLKIDRSFIRNVTTDSNDLALSEAIIMMAHKLGMKVVAEGIETQGQLSLMQKTGCDYGQGYLFSQAVLPSDFEKLLRQGMGRGWRMGTTGVGFRILPLE
jgi:diguanylate cyclase (GGDEF)-like protein